MFTRYYQIFEFNNIKLKKMYADYMLYVWNKKTLNFLRKCGIREFTATPELSVEQNKNIYEGENVQYILAGRPALVYTRNCFKDILDCPKCDKNEDNSKIIFNE